MIDEKIDGLHDDVRMALWFARRSWAYLGCDRGDYGTGRWQARWRYLRGLVPAGRTFLAACRRDRAALLTRAAADGGEYTP